MDLNTMSESDKSDWLKNQERMQEIMRAFKPTPNKLKDRPKPLVVKPVPAQQVVEVRAGGSETKFKPGESGNRSGRPKGSKNKLTQQLIDNVGGVLDVMVAKALEGDAAAAALVVNRVLPTLRPQSEMVQFVLNVDEPTSKQVEQVLAAVARGEVAADVGQRIIVSIQALASVRATEDLEQRILALEAKQI